METKNTKVIGSAKILLSGKMVNIELYKIDTINKGFSGSIIEPLTKTKIKIRNTQVNKLSIDNLVDVVLDYKLNTTSSKDNKNIEV